jgi:pimeloyl-ACP methyl ester carboxylesterase
MPETATHAMTTGALEVPGAVLHYELRGRGPLIALHAAPMDADAFVPLAELLAGEFTVLTSDPRGIHRSRGSDPDRDVSPDQRADDLAALITHVEAGPAVVVGSSGGAVSALALLQQHPDLVTAVVAHEPPLAELLPDRDELHRRTVDMVRTYVAGDRISAWHEFLDIADIHLPDDVFDMIFGQAPEGQAVRDERFAFEHMELPTTFWAPDLEELRNRRDRLIIAIGEDSTGQLCDRASRALAVALGLEPAAFPGDHIGFVDDPLAFARRLREVLDSRWSEAR